MPVSHRIKAAIAAAVVTPALVFAPTAVAQDGSATPNAELPTSSIDTGQIGAVAAVGSALLDAGVGIGDIITIFSALQAAGVSVSDMIAVFSFLAENPGALDIVLGFINSGAFDVLLRFIR